MKQFKLQLPCNINEWFHGALHLSNIQLFYLTPEIVARAVNLSSIHKDPFDRIIIATLCNIKLI